MPLHSKSRPFQSSKPLVLAASVTLLASSLAACGGESQDRGVGKESVKRLTTGLTQAERAGGTQSLPTDSQIKSAQNKVINPAEHRLKGVKLPGDLGGQTVRPNSSTAPADALTLAARAGRQWLLYRVNGKAPDSSVIPRSVWDGVPPMVPTERVKGAALSNGVKVFEAHPTGDEWSASVLTRDPRLPVIRLQIARDGDTVRVKEIDG
ncbi:MAG: hypothetical protein Q7T55_06485 [Solirubrobacteraceae bacterium]|nr:hypothetical protein [Solirubrobacteraceae bacterium]